MSRAPRSLARLQQRAELLQVGHQRRSNPRYQHARDKLLREQRLLGRITNITGQWNRAVTEDFGFPNGQAIPEAKLNKYGYANMHEFRNWRWFRKYAGGPVSDLGAHQIDIYNWMLGANPRLCIASGGVDYYKSHEWYDNAFIIFEYETKDGVIRAQYQVLTTTSAGGGFCSRRCSPARSSDSTSSFSPSAVRISALSRRSLASSFSISGSVIFIIL